MVTDRILLPLRESVARAFLQIRDNEENGIFIHRVALEIGAMNATTAKLDINNLIKSEFFLSGLDRDDTREIHTKILYLVNLFTRCYSRNFRDLSQVRRVIDYRYRNRCLELTLEVDE